MRQDVFALNLEVVEEERESSEEPGTILEQTPGAGTVRQGRTVTFVVAEKEATTVTTTRSPTETTSETTDEPTETTDEPSETTDEPEPTSTSTTSSLEPSSPEPTGTRSPRSTRQSPSSP